MLKSLLLLGCSWAVLLISIIVDTVQRKLKFVNYEKKPVLTCFLEAVFTIPKRLRLGYYSKKTNDILVAVELAMKTTKLTDMGGKDGGKTMVKRYQVVRAIGIEKSGARYTPFGYIVALEVLKKRMETRLKFVDYLKRNPMITQISMKSPVFVIGFPRTGTTFLHELLGLHPQVRMHYSWEQMEPVPRTKSEKKSDLTADRLSRYSSNKMKFNTLTMLAGNSIQSIHRIGYDEPEECTTPCAIELPWGVLELPLNVYAAKDVFALGAGETFDFYKAFLQMMTYQSEDRSSGDFTWMLKCPFHLPYLEELHATFPDATVVWTHRDPVECIASACSLYETLLITVFETDSVDRAALGRAVCEYSILALEKALQTIKKLGHEFKILHIKYQDTVKSPKEVCLKVMSSANLDFSAKYVSRIDDYLEKNRRERLQKQKDASKRLHEYSLNDYGLSVDEVRSQFAKYVAQYC